MPDLRIDTVAEALAEANFDKDYTYLEDLEEWISLTALHSPRVQVGDYSDPFCCRYSAPSRSDIVDHAASARYSPTSSTDTYLTGQLQLTFATEHPAPPAAASQPVT